MKKCPVCGNVYPEPFNFCPVDGGDLQVPAGAADARPPEDQGPVHKEAAEFTVKSATDEEEVRAEEEDPLDPSLRAGVAPAGVSPASGSRAVESPQIKVKTLLLGVGALVLVAAVAFAAVFAYLYLKPKYGGLVIKTTPPGATVFVDDQARGPSPLTLVNIRSGGHKIKVSKEGYEEFLQQVEVPPYSNENIHLELKPLVPQLTNEQLAEVEALKKKLDSALSENILFPPPEDYNVLYFADKILEIDPADAYVVEVKGRIADSLQQRADIAYAKEDWLAAEKEYKNLALLFPDDIAVNERLTDIAAKIDASIKDREQQVASWQKKAEAAIKEGTLLPPAKDNALDALRSIQRLDKRNGYAREAMLHILEMLQNRGDTKLASGDLQGARSEFRLVLQYFPDDKYSNSRLAMVEGKIAEAERAEQLKRLRAQQEQQQARQNVANLREAAISAYHSGAYAKAVEDWQEYLKYEPDSDEAYFYLGATYLEEKQLDTAILNFEKCIALNPNNAYAHLNLGILYDRQRNDLEKAAEHLEKVKSLGGVDKYGPDRLESMIQALRDRREIESLTKRSFAVEHKHVFSSCRGVLRITAEGVEFRTTESDHSFYEAYGNLRSFELDGEEISIRTRNNKNYNFQLLAPGDVEMVRRLAAHYIKMH